jgi:hypothetical protein
VIVEAEDGRTLVARVVTADAFEEAGTVVEGVRENASAKSTMRPFIQIFFTSSNGIGAS